MSTLHAILSIANSALKANQRAVQVTSHNVANAGTPGYSRQRLEISTAMPLIKPYGSIGTGVAIGDTVRIRDALLDTSYRREYQSASGFSLRHDILRRIESALGEPSESGLGAQLDAFWSAWADLADEPASSAARTVVRQRGAQVADTLNQLNDELARTASVLENQLDDTVRRFNALTSHIADLNRQIVAAETGGASAPDLRDARDLAIDELAAFGAVRVVEDANGAVAVIVDSTTVVDRAQAFAIEVRNTPDGWAVGGVGRESVIAPPGGELSALLDGLNTEIPKRKEALDALAAALVGAVNDAHRTGTNPHGETDVDFFDPDGVTAATIRLSAAVQADASRIAAGAGDPDGNYLAGTNDVALRMAAMRFETQAALGDSFSEFYIGIVTELGLAVRSAGESAEVHTTLAAQAEALRASVSGVSHDEELIQLLQFQSAYAAAAKVVNAADEMMRTVIELV